MSNQNGEIRKLPPFGRQMRSEFFMDPDFTFLNQGSYGTHPKSVAKALQEYQLRSEKNPDLLYRQWGGQIWPELTKVREMLAELINADPEDVVMIPNDTSGMNAIFRSMVFAPGERILHLNTIYDSMGSLIQYIVDSSKGKVSKVVFDVTFPMTNDQYLEKFENFLDEVHDPSKPIRIALIDHISSSPGVLNPIERMIPMLKSRNIIVLIDGAHAIGQVPIDIKGLDPDYYLTNCHKWMYAARGCSLMYVKKQHQATIHPAHINVSYQTPAHFQKEFVWIGTMDFSPYMTVPAALQFRKDVGGESAIMKYNHNLAYEGGRRMAARFQTRILQDEDQIGSMVDVQLPVQDVDHSKLSVPHWFSNIQLNKYPNTFAPVYKHNGRFWVRVSAQIYNDLSDFEALAEHFLAIIREELNDHQKSGKETSDLFDYVF